MFIAGVVFGVGALACFERATAKLEVGNDFAATLLLLGFFALLTVAIFIIGYAGPSSALP